MKKFLALIIFMCISVAAISQPRAIGVRLGYVNEFSYQHSAGNGGNFYEFDLGLLNVSAFQATAVYDFIIASPQWTAGSWNFYGGPGIGVGFWWYNYAALYAGVAGQFGLEYTFDKIPLQLSADYKPLIAFEFGSDPGFFRSGFWNFALSVRYRF